MSTADDLSALLASLRSGGRLSVAASGQAIGAMMSGAAKHAEMAEFLTILADRGPTVDEITGAAREMRAHMLPVRAPLGAIDMCGTGGDHQGTLNVSTAASFVVAAAGVPVAKHGNRAMSSRTGAADVLEALGVKIALASGGAEQCLDAAGLSFLFAQTHHPAMRHVGPVRKQLARRTLFNLLGPLANPAGVRRQLLGVFGPEWIQPLAETLRALGAEKAWVVHGSDGLDEITITGPTRIAALENGNVRLFQIAPEDAGLARAPIESIKGGGADENAQAVRALLAGQKGPFRDIVLLNAAAALIVADKASSLREGVAKAALAIDSGAAADALAKLAAASQKAAE